MPATQPYFSFPISDLCWVICCLQKGFPDIAYDRILPCRVHWLEIHLEHVHFNGQQGSDTVASTKAPKVQVSHRTCVIRAGPLDIKDILNPVLDIKDILNSLEHLKWCSSIMFGQKHCPSAMRPFTPSKGCQFFQYFCNRRDCAQLVSQ